MVQHYVKHTNLNKKQVNQYLLPPSNVWLSAQEALKFGMVDKIIG